MTGTKSPLMDPALYIVVFFGGAAGTGMRYVCSVLNTDLADGAGTVFDVTIAHWGTLLANLAACFVYAALTAFLAHSPWIAQRRRDLVNRGFGMGMCGGLSTMSTLAVEWLSGVQHAASQNTWIIDTVLYVVASFVCGLIAAFIGAAVGSRWGDRVTAAADGIIASGEGGGR